MQLIAGFVDLSGDQDASVHARAMLKPMVPAVPGWRERVWDGNGISIGLLFGSDAELSPLVQRDGSVIASDARLDEPFGEDPAQWDWHLAQLAARDPASLAEVLGDFAFAHWDDGGRRLTCGRDVFGIRPLYYAYEPGRFFAFASLPCAIHGAGIVPRRADRGAIVRWLATSGAAHETLIQGILRLPPAHFLVLEGGTLTVQRYWRIDRAAIGTNPIESAAAAAKMRRLMDQAVRCRLPAGGQVGAHLSGGLDSSAVAVLAARGLREEGRTLRAWSFLDRPRNDIALEDERPFVEAVLEQEPGIDWSPVGGATDWLAGGRDYDDYAALAGEDDPEHRVCADAAAKGVSLILSGWGGDEAASFNGRAAIAEQLIGGQFGAAMQELRAFARERGLPLSRAIRNEVTAYLIPDRLRNFARSLTGRQTRRWSALAGLSDAALAALEGAAQPLTMSADARENRASLITGTHIADRAESWAATGARYGVAFAFPLLDRRVVEFALSLPSAMFLQAGRRRQVFRQAMHGVLPQSVRERHHKLSAFPGITLDMVDNREILQQRLEAIEARSGNDVPYLDFERMRTLLAAFPDPGEVRAAIAQGTEPDPVAMSAVVAVVVALGTADFLDQYQP
jgi:asparagine synthase (glutamine-hydrolysing)